VTNRAKCFERQEPKLVGLFAPILDYGMDALKSAGRAIIRSPSLAKQSWGVGRHKSKYWKRVDYLASGYKVSENG
jgi:hypothetical protein